MADCNNLFIEFNNTISLDDPKKKKLIESRNLLREDIRTYMKKNKPDEIAPEFYGQGSYMMKTIVNPFSTEEEYDLDDGVYFKDKDLEDRKDTSTYHEWIYEAVKDRTKKQIDKNTCVRVIYSDGHHIDLPIYFIIEGEIPELAHKSDGWVISDPREFYRWFRDESKDKDQLKRIVRYLKAWCDKENNGNKNIKMLSGMIMTILATNEFSSDEREDIAFRDTLSKINNKLTSLFSCYRPTTPTSEDLLKEISDTRKDNFLNKLSAFLTSANQAIKNPNQKKACLKWQKHFGDRFSCSNAKEEIEDSREYARPAVISMNAKSGIK